ncbi:MAG: type II secretion system protein GspN [Pseudomonadota bacterium]
MTDRTSPRWLRMLGYAGFFGLCFVISLYLTFPMSAIKPRVVDMLQKAVQQAGPQPGRYGTQAEVQIERVDIYRLTGLELTRLSVRLATTEPDPGPTWEFDRARARLQLLPLILGHQRVGFDVDLYDGNLSGSALVVDQNLAELDAELEGVAVGKVPVVLAALGVPLEGLIGGTVDLKLGKDPKEAKGTIVLQGQGHVLGPGEFKIPGLTGGLTVPAIDLGVLDVQVEVADGKARVKPAGLKGKDVEVASDLTLTLRSPLGRSTAAGALEFRLAEAFLKANEKFQPILDFTPQLKRAKDKDGSYHFKLAGSLASLRPVPDPKAKVN